MGFRLPSSRIWRHVVWLKFLDVSEEHAASIFRVVKQAKQAAISVHQITRRHMALFTVTAVRASDLQKET
jgi:hypothetical protein